MLICKKELLDKTAMRISVIGKKYQLTIKQKILEEHFDSNDLESLLLEYIFEDSRIQETIKKIAITNFERKNPKFRKTVITENILNSFHKKGWVGKVKEEEIRGIDYYRAYSKDNSKER